jgi:hypothetical protein
MIDQELFGWVPPQERTNEQHELNEAALASMPAFSLDGTYHEDKGKFDLSEVAVKNGAKFIWQVTGSCVGAGGGTMIQTLMGVEIAAGELEEMRQVWWPYTYGQSRRRAGMRGQGAGSFGGAWAAAARDDGFFSRDEAGSGIPEFDEPEPGWYRLSKEVEYAWSDGAATQGKYASLAKVHVVKTVSPISNSSEAKAAIANGYPLTLASMFGTRGAVSTGNPAVPLAEWNDQWAHQMSCSVCWDHPSLGLIFGIRNQWGPQLHPFFYVRASVFDRICAGKEVFAFSAFDGFKSRSIPWIF